MVIRDVYTAPIAIQPTDIMGSLSPIPAILYIPPALSD